MNKMTKMIARKNKNNKIIKVNQILMMKKTRTIVMERELLKSAFIMRTIRKM